MQFKFWPYILVASFFGGRLVIGSPSVDKEIQQLESENSPLLNYPTIFTQNIVPKQIHSHNDCQPMLKFLSFFFVDNIIDWRDVPVLTALSLGVASIEADVWLVNGTLFIGHELAALTPARTFDSVYVQPLLTIINNMNPKNAFTASQTTPKLVLLCIPVVCFNECILVAYLTRLRALHCSSWLM